MKFKQNRQAEQFIDDASESLQLAESFLEADPVMPMAFNSSFAVEYIEHATRELRTASEIALQKETRH